MSFFFIQTLSLSEPPISLTRDLEKGFHIFSLNGLIFISNASAPNKKKRFNWTKALFDKCQVIICILRCLRQRLPEKDEEEGSESSSFPRGGMVSWLPGWKSEKDFFP